MKICLIMGGDEEGGLENHVVELGNALASRHNVHIIAHAKYEDRFKGVSFHAIDLTKSQVIKFANSLNINLGETISCYQPEENKECGVCLSCTVKQDALNGIY